MIKLKDLLNEELVGKLDSVEIYKNPKSIKRMASEIRAVSFPNGDLYVASERKGIIHIELHEWLRQEGNPVPRMHSLDEVEDGINKGFINWHRDSNTYDFYLSEYTDPYDRLSEKTKKNIDKYIKITKKKNPKINFIKKRIWDK